MKRKGLHAKEREREREEGGGGELIRDKREDGTRPGRFQFHLSLSLSPSLFVSWRKSCAECSLLCIPDGTHKSAAAIVMM